MAATGALLSISAVTPDPAIPLPHLVLVDSTGAVVGPVVASATSSFVTIAIEEDGQTFLVEAGRNRFFINGHRPMFLMDNCAGPVYLYQLSHFTTFQPQRLLGMSYAIGAGNRLFVGNNSGSGTLQVQSEWDNREATCADLNEMRDVQSATLFTDLDAPFTRPFKLQ
jgi:hypothetical protein